MPFRGSRARARELRSNLEALTSDPADELIVADNNPEQRAADCLAGLARVIHAGAERSSYHARNAGAALARCDWILFLDADCEPSPGLLGAYFAPRPDERTGLLGGTIVAGGGAGNLLTRYAVDRHFLCAEHGLQRDRGYAPSGNLMVRRRAFEAVGGFTEGIRSAGDVDLCWRLQGAGWQFERRPQAGVAHRHREDLPSFLAMLVRYGAGASWLNERYPGSAARWPLSGRELARAGRDAVRFGIRGEREEAAFRLIDALGLLAHNVGYAASNEVRAPAAPGSPPPSRQRAPRSRTWSAARRTRAGRPS